MYKPVESFLISFFSIFLMVLVLVNYLGWSGAYVNVLGGYDAIDLTTGGVMWGNGYYFTFTSFLNMVDDLESYFSMGNSPLKIANFIKFLNITINAVTMDLPNLFSKLIDTGNGIVAIARGGFSTKNTIDILRFIGNGLVLVFSIIGNLLTFCIVPILALVMAVLWILLYAIMFIAVLLRAFAGYYNVPMMGESIDINMYDSISSVLAHVQPYIV